MAYLCKNGHLVKNSWQAGQPCSRCKANDRRREKRLGEMLDGMHDPNEARKNYLIDKTAEYRMMGYKQTEAREKAMSDWLLYEANKH